ncbi:sigma 54-interacting transcriptional regulator [Flavitalea sp.]|nr:sigma 54-interacting transcriptional regulator [Flavitalea sp.]
MLNRTNIQPPAQKSILIVEDEFAVANDLRSILQKAGYRVSGIAFNVVKALESIEQELPDLVLLDIHLNGSETGIDLARKLGEVNIPFVFVSANTDTSLLEDVKTTEPYGFIVKPFRERDVLVALEIAHYRHAHSVEVRISHEQALQIAMIAALSEPGDWEQRLLKVTRLLQSHIPFDYLAIGIEREQALDTFGSCSFFRVAKEEYQVIKPENFLQMTGLTSKRYQDIREHVSIDGKAIYNNDEFKAECRRNPLKGIIARTFHLQSHLLLPFRIEKNGTFFLSFYSRQENTYFSRHLHLLERIQPSLTVTIERLMAFDEIERLSEQLRRENSYLQEEVQKGANFEDIKGSNPALLQVFTSVSQVAPTDYAVLILGETGTGKELIARAVHNRSNRREKPLIKVNCASLPAQLIESELFGHEKGSFTGATEKRIGKFELADRGTIFLDEIGELPLELQPKLLRVLQEKEIERIGGKGAFSCDVRIIAATNRNLQLEITQGRFRTDLFYRLNVFPIRLPPLRERKDDLLTLVNYFLQKIVKKLGKNLTGISEESLHEMHRYHWPGNIRELEHVLERAAIMTTSPTISIVEPLLNDLEVPPAGILPLLAVKPFEQAERENILAALEQAHYRIRGQGGAAEILNLKPTTLEAKMARLGISRKM